MMTLLSAVSFPLRKIICTWTFLLDKETAKFDSHFGLSCYKCMGSVIKASIQRYMKLVFVLTKNMPEAM